MFKISRAELVSMLAQAMRIVPANSSLDILGNFKIIVERDQLTIQANDLDAAISIYTGICSDSEFKICMPERKLFDLIRECPDGMIEISEDNTILFLKCEHDFEAKLSGRDTKEFPAMPKEKSSIEFSFDTANLLALISKSEFATAGDESRGPLFGICFEWQKGQVIMVATDGHRLGSSRIAYDLGDFRAVVPGKQAAYLARVLDISNQSTQIAIGERYLQATCGKTSLCIKLMDSAYPNYQQVIPANNPKEAIIDRQKFLKAIKRCQVLSNHKTHLVKCFFTSAQLEIAVQNKEIGGEAQELIPIEYTGDEHKIGFNAQYLVEILEVLQTTNIRLTMNSQVSGALFYPVYDREEQKTSEDLFLLMPLRILEV